jgi:hypothetical protein
MSKKEKKGKRYYGTNTGMMIKHVLEKTIQRAQNVSDKKT